MSEPEESCEPDICDYWLVSEAAGNLANQACTLGASHIKDGILRIQFNREVAYYARVIANDVAQGIKSPEQGLIAIKNEQNSLLSQSTEVTLKGAGVIAGALQFAAGAGICYGSVGTLCLLAGAPMMAHGANNVYENGRNFLQNRTDTQGPVRKGYQKAAKIMGHGAFKGNMAYDYVDLGLSAYGVSRLVPKPDAWRLFRYVRADYVRAHKNMSKPELAVEVISIHGTTKSMYRETNDNDN